MAAGDLIGNTAVTRGPRSASTGTPSPGNETGERESLADVIAMVDPDEVALLSNLTKGPNGQAVYEDWLIEELEDVDDTNDNEGASWNPSASKMMDRIGNFMVIKSGQKSVSGTFDAVDLAGRDRETARQKVLAGKVVKRKINRSLYLNQTYSGAGPRRNAGFPAYVGNIIGGVGYQPGGWAGTQAFTPGTPRAFDSGADLLDVLQTAHENGGHPTQLYMTAGLKRDFSAITDIGLGTMQAQFDTSRRSGAALAFFGAVDKFQSDWGWHDVIVDLNRPLYGGPPANVAYVLCLDPRYAEIRYLPGRNMLPVDVAKQGDHTPIMLLSEYTLVVNAPKAHGIVADLNNASLKSEAGHDDASTLAGGGGSLMALGAEGDTIVGLSEGITSGGPETAVAARTTRRASARSNTVAGADDADSFA